MENLFNQSPIPDPDAAAPDSKTVPCASSPKRAAAKPPRPDVAPRIICDLPKHLPVLTSEIALLRSFLADEINAILFDDL